MLHFGIIKWTGYCNHQTNKRTHKKHFTTCHILKMDILCLREQDRTYHGVIHNQCVYTCASVIKFIQYLNESILTFTVSFLTG